MIERRGGERIRVLRWNESGFGFAGTKTGGGFGHGGFGRGRF